MRRIIHTMLRVTNLSHSIDFYTRILGMNILRTLNQPDEKYTLVFLGYAAESESCVLELTYNYGITQYEPGTAFGHIAISVDDCKAVCADIRDNGGEVIHAAMQLNGSDEIIAFVRDPDGYQVELIERP